ncbi:prepilin peptidase [Rhodoblastus acidophilus]|uniref:Protein translocase subunit SecA n=1 Tax=Candidatus Rhodoblastus alkanivorans TaxID=2954117 RepID=A0ABS9Z2Z4_9HYPH|nr:DEAD/DEAH box helicase [Candidatus Rhodoblastus alkanivorans]MCI4677310.1 prepilin peptidase [Candidatus Rhodoblastus alkanivorans]MCI4682045.1 prepilin peptidase [Candidatus Rhodoblastus alkanivorans]MDI4639347.1 prepilin peptidase [Rhodoblastus acidophilus]
MPSATVLSRSVKLAPGRPYPERAEPTLGWHDHVAEFLWFNVAKPLWRTAFRPTRSLGRVVVESERHEAALQRASDEELKAKAGALRQGLRRDGFELSLAGETFALVREAASRTLGLRHFPTQMMAGWAMLQGRLVEMETGEGKSLAATLPACAAALAGAPVHIVTVNDYLAKRDAEAMKPLYDFLGLSVGAAVQGMTRSEKRAVYKKSVVYCTNKELAFDYLRDGAARSGRRSRLHLCLDRLGGLASDDDAPVLRGLHFAIVDEADSVFIDEARTPLILSASAGDAEETETFRQALDLAAGLEPGSDFEIEHAERYCLLTEAGRDKLALATRDFEGIWQSEREREERVIQALSAICLFERDKHYVVADGKVQIVDENTGRILPDRSWERGLHQMIEVKEDCEPTQRRETIARLTYQRLFRRYLLLAGITGTAKEVAREIRTVYGLDVARIPLHRPSQRRYTTPRLCPTKEEKWRIVERVVKVARERGLPVLIGTRSVHASEEISSLLRARGVDHALLNAKQDNAEAEIVAAAGEPGRVTVATNMAGRGTDIKLADGVREVGGLNVILTEYHESQRIDRQLFGRCARQGDPGSCHTIVSLEDDFFLANSPWLAAQAARILKMDRRFQPLALRILRLHAQYVAESRNSRQRVASMRSDERWEQILAFSGRRE